MKISIITVCYNASLTIEDTLQSIRNQSYKKIEHIIIDGKSTDGTCDVIKKYEKYVSAWVSEPDDGIFDAMNKGLSLATGDIIGFLNADDVYARDDVLDHIVKTLSKKHIDACYTDLLYVSQRNINKNIRYWKSCDYNSDLHKSGWVPPHLTFFARRDVYKQFGNFDIEFPLAADFELLLRFFHIHKIRTKYLPFVSVKMRMGGASNQSLANIVQQNIEIWKSYKKNSINISLPYFLITKFKSKASQFLFKKKKLQESKVALSL